MRPGGGPPGGSPPSAGAAPASQAAPIVVAFAAEGGRWAWLERAGEETVLYTGGPGGERKERARGRGWSEVAVSANSIWVLARDGERGSILGVPPGGGAPAPAVSGLLRPGGLYAVDDTLYWLEAAPPALPQQPQIPAASEVRVRRRSGSGGVETVDAWPGDAVTGPGDVVGLLDHALIVRIRRLGSTEFIRIPLQGGEVERLAVERGFQAGLIWRGAFYRTAPSREAAPDEGRSVRRLGPDGRDEWLTDWLPSGGRLLPLQDGLYYGSDALYRLPSRLNAPTAVTPLRFQALVDADGILVRTDGPGAPAVDPTEAR